MRVTLLVWSLSSLAGLALAPSVFAQASAAQTSGEPTAAARAEARRVVAGATRAYNRGQFERARQEYQRAYELYPAPGLLFNLGQCERELGHHERAIGLFERYLHERPDAPNRELVLGLVGESRLALGPRAASAESQRESVARAELERARRELAEARERGAAQLEAQEARYGAAVAELERARQALEQSRSRVIAAELAVEAAPGPPVYEEWWFWTVLVGVAAAVGVGIGLGVHFGAPQLPAGSLGTIDAR